MTNSIGEQTPPQRREIFEEYLMHYDQAWQNGNVKVCNDRQVTGRARHVLLSETDPVERFTTFDFYHIAFECVNLGVRDCRSAFHIFIKAAEVLETLCVNLFLFPWKKEIKIIKTFTGPFVYCVQPVFPKAVLRGILEKMGYYLESDTEYRLSPSADYERAKAMGFEMFLARVESQYLLEVMGQRAHAECLEVLTRRAGALLDPQCREEWGGSGEESTPGGHWDREGRSKEAENHQSEVGGGSVGVGALLGAQERREREGGSGGVGALQDHREVEGGRGAGMRVLQDRREEEGGRGAGVVPLGQRDQREGLGGSSEDMQGQRDRERSSSSSSSGVEMVKSDHRESAVVLDHNYRDPQEEAQPRDSHPAAAEKEREEKEGVREKEKERDCEDFRATQGVQAGLPLPDVLSLAQPAAAPAPWESQTAAEASRPSESHPDRATAEWDSRQSLKLEEAKVGTGVAWPTATRTGVAWVVGGAGGGATSGVTESTGMAAGSAAVGARRALGGVTEPPGVATGSSVEAEGARRATEATVVAPGGIATGLAAVGSGAAPGVGTPVRVGVFGDSSSWVPVSSAACNGSAEVAVGTAAQLGGLVITTDSVQPELSSSSLRERASSFLSDDRSIMEMRHNYPDLAIRQKPIFLSRRQRGGSYPTPGPKAPRSRLGDDGDIMVGPSRSSPQAAELTGPQPISTSEGPRSQVISTSASELSRLRSISSRSNFMIHVSNLAGPQSISSRNPLITSTSDLSGPQSISSRNPLITSTSDLSGPQSISLLHPGPLVPTAGCTLSPITTPVPKAISPIAAIPKPIASIPVSKPGLPIPMHRDDILEPQPVLAISGPASVIHYHDRATAVGQRAVPRLVQQGVSKDPDLQQLELTARLGQLCLGDMSVDEPLKYPIEETQAQAQAQACSMCHGHLRHTGAVATSGAVVAAPTSYFCDNSHDPILCTKSPLLVCSISGCSSCAGPDVLKHHQHPPQHSLHVGASTIKEPPSSLYMPPSPLGVCPPGLEPLTGHLPPAVGPGPLGQPGASQQPEDELLQTYVLVEPDRK